MDCYFTLLEDSTMSYPQDFLKSLDGRPRPRFTTGDRVRFTFPFSNERQGNVLRRWWGGAWCYVVSDPNGGEWLLSEKILDHAIESPTAGVTT